MKNIIKPVFAVASALLLMTGCTDKFEKMNMSPNSPLAGNVDPKFEFQYAVSRSIAYRNTYQSGEQITIAHFIEYDANSTQSSSDYDMTNADVAHVWDQSYKALADLNNIIRTYEEDPVNSNVANMAKIWKCWVMLRVTDFFGDVPYSEAASAEAKAPKYDTQEEIYNLMFTQLTEASNALSASKPNIGNYDLIYNGDVTKWKKFANSLRFRMAVRIFDAAPSKAKSEAAAAIAAGMFTSKDDEAKMTMGESTNSDYTWNPLYYGRNSSHSTVHMSSAYYKIVVNLGGINWPTAADQLLNKNINDDIVNAVDAPAMVDPRSPIHFETVGRRGVNDATKAGMWRGSEPGHSNHSTLSGEIDGGKDFCTNYSSVGPFFYSTATKPWPIFEYSELCFLKAIATVRGIADAGDAKSLYEEGIKADMADYGIPDATVSSYINSTSANAYGTTVAWSDNSGNCNTAMDKIITQKYIAGFIEGAWECWSDHRQYHKPTLVPFANVFAAFKRTQADVDNNTPNAYIKRGYYPADEQTTNPENLAEAVKRLGGEDSVQKNVWWDVD